MGSMTFRLNAFRQKDISPKRNTSKSHFVEYDISSKFRLKGHKVVSILSSVSSLNKKEESDGTLNWYFF